MAQEILERKNEILRRKIETMVLKNNKKELSRHDNLMLQRFIKEFHQNAYQLNSN